MILLLIMINYYRNESIINYSIKDRIIKNKAKSIKNTIEQLAIEKHNKIYSRIKNIPK